MKKLLLAAVASIGLAAAANAGPISVIQFSQNTATQDVIIANNLGLTGATGATTINITDGTANISQLLGNVTPINNVDVDLSATSVDNATGIGPAIIQHFSGTYCISSGAGCTGTKYLDGSFTDAAFGLATGSQLTVNVANPPDALTLNSDVIPAASLLPPTALGFTFVSLSSPLSIAANNSIAADTGTFSGNASATPAPEPASLLLLGTGMLGLGFVARRKRS